MDVGCSRGGGIRVPCDGEVVGEGIQPHVDHVIVRTRHRYSPLNARGAPRDGEVRKPFIEHSQHFAAPVVWNNHWAVCTLGEVKGLRCGCAEGRVSRPSRTPPFHRNAPRGLSSIHLRIGPANSERRNMKLLSRMRTTSRPVSRETIVAAVPDPGGSSPLGVTWGSRRRERGGRAPGQCSCTTACAVPGVDRAGVRARYRSAHGLVFSRDPGTKWSL